ncbi:MAG: hypothetical protein IH614_07455 [Desulfuromonadales bacterium]|nr:hypothetical protein [Desulfuromonadales bacterium]
MLVITVAVLIGFLLGVTFMAVLFLSRDDMEGTALHNLDNSMASRQEEAA